MKCPARRSSPFDCDICKSVEDSRNFACFSFCFCLCIIFFHLICGLTTGFGPRGPCQQVWMLKFIHKNSAAPFFSGSCRNEAKNDDKKESQERSIRKEVAASAVEEDATQGPFMVNEVRLETVSHFSGDQQDDISDRPGICSEKKIEEKLREMWKEIENKNCTPKSIFVNVPVRSSMVTNTAFGGSIDRSMLIRWSFKIETLFSPLSQLLFVSWKRLKPRVSSHHRATTSTDVLSNAQLITQTGSICCT